MWIRQCLLGILGMSFGIAAAGGLFSFIIGLGVISDFADRTHTGKHVCLYEDSVALGGIVGLLVLLFRLPVVGGNAMLGVFGFLSGIFVGCWAMALAEILNLFPIFIRRTKLVERVSLFILALAVGKLLGAILFFCQGW